MLEKTKYFQLSSLRLHLYSMRVPILLLFIMLLGFLVRFDAWYDWQQFPYKTLYQGVPVLLNLDGYFYLSLAQDYQNDSYSNLDIRRGFPGVVNRPHLPLISMVTAWLAKVTSYSINWIAVFLPALIGVLLAVPVYLSGKVLAGRAVGLISALLAILWPHYVYRTMIGWYDTDILLVTVLAFSGYFSVMLMQCAEDQKWKYVLFLTLNVTIGVLWWDQAQPIALILFFLPLLVAIVLPGKSLLSLFQYIYLLLFISFITWFLHGYPLIGMIEKTLPYVNYVLGVSDADLPSIAMRVAEQSGFSAFMHGFDIGVFIVIMLSLVGLLLLIKQKISAVVVIGVPLILAFSGLWAGRFFIFAAPVVGIGSAYLVSYVSSKLPLDRKVLLLIFATITLAYLQVMNVLTTPKMPHIHPDYISGMEKLGEIVDRDSAVIWSWWDHGYPISYYSGKPVVGDGQAHGPYRTISIAKPLASSNKQYSANYMYFYIAHGPDYLNYLQRESGMSYQEADAFVQNVLSMDTADSRHLVAERFGNENVAEWMKYFYPHPTRQIFLFLDYHMTELMDSIMLYGSWDFSGKAGQGAFYTYQIGVNKVDRASVTNGRLEFDFDTGEGLINNEKFFARYAYDSSHKGQYRSYSNNSESELAIMYKAESGEMVACQLDACNSVFNQLFFSGEDKGGNFVKIFDDHPGYQAWRVVRDQ